MVMRPGAARTLENFEPQPNWHSPHLGKGLLAGAAGGLLGAWVMIRMADAWSGIHGGNNRSRLGTEEEWDVASNVVDILTRRVLHVKLKRRNKQRAASGFHYAFGALAGAIYGVTAEVAPRVSSGAGAPFGAIEWLLGNKFTAPRLGLIKPRDRYARQERVKSFAAHILFGVTTELARRGMRGEW